MKHSHIHRYIILLAAAGFSSAAASGQGLVKEVEGIRDFAPDKRPANRIEVAPESVAPQWDAAAPRYSRTSVAVNVPPSLSVMGLTRGGGIYPGSDSRGYAALGYFPKGDIDLSAGYRIIDKERLSLNVWAQMCRNYFHGRLLGFTKNMRLTTTDIAAGASFAYAAGRAGVVTASTSYSYGMFNYPGGIIFPPSQRVGTYRLNAAWDGRAGERFTYGAKGSMIHTGFAKVPDIPDGAISGIPLSTSEIGGSIGAWLDFRCDNQKCSLLLDIDYEGYSRAVPSPVFPLDKEDRSQLLLSKGVVSVTPKVRFTGRRMNGHLGFNLAFGTGDAGGTDAGADVEWNWVPSDYFAFNLKATSGPVVNSFDRLHALSRYAMPPYGVVNSYIPLDAEASLNLLSIKGFTVSVGGGYAVANDWISTALVHSEPTYSLSDLRALRYFAKAGYRYSDKIEVELSIEGIDDDHDAEFTTPDGIEYYEWSNRSYYRYADRATTIVRASALWHPISSVAISAAYEYRTGRSIATLYAINEPALAKLGDVNQLTVRAHWQINRLVGVYGSVEGICQRRYLQADGMPGQRLRPLVGVTLKF